MSQDATDNMASCQDGGIDITQLAQIQIVKDVQVFSGMYVSAALGVVCLLAFAKLQQCFKRHYRHRLTGDCVTVLPPPLPDTGWGATWGWVQAIFASGQSTLLKTAGLDALVMLKTITLGLQMFGPMALLSCCTLIPMALKKGYLLRPDSKVQAGSLMQLTIANIPDKSPLLWIHFIMFYLYLVYAMTLLWWNYKNFIVARQDFLMRGDEQNHWQELLDPNRRAQERRVHEGKKLALRTFHKLYKTVSRKSEILEDHVAQHNRLGSTGDKAVGLAQLQLARMQSPSRPPSPLYMQRHSNPTLPSPLAIVSRRFKLPTIKRKVAPSSGDLEGMPVRESSRLSVEGSVTSRERLPNIVGGKLGPSTAAIHPPLERILDNQLYEGPLPQRPPPWTGKGPTSDGHSNVPVVVEDELAARRLSISEEEPWVVARRTTDSHNIDGAMLDEVVPSGRGQPGYKHDMTASSHNFKDSSVYKWYSMIPTKRYSGTVPSQVLNSSHVDLSSSLDLTNIIPPPTTQPRPPLRAKPSIRCRKTVNVWDWTQCRKVAVSAQSYAVLVTDAAAGPYPRSKKLDLSEKTEVPTSPVAPGKASDSPVVKLVQSPLWRSLLMKTSCTWATMSMDYEEVGQGTSMNLINPGSMPGNKSKEGTRLNQELVQVASNIDIVASTTSSSSSTTVPVTINRHHRSSSSGQGLPAFGQQRPPMLSSVSGACPGPLPHRSASLHVLCPGSPTHMRHSSNGGRTPSGKSTVQRKYAHLKKWAIVRAALRDGELLALPYLEEYDQVSAVFKRLFPADFDRVVPVFDHKEVDKLLHKWEAQVGKLEQAEARTMQGQAVAGTDCFGLPGSTVESVEEISAKLERLEQDIAKARAKALQSRFTPSCFVLFKSQMAATIAANTAILQEDELHFKVHPAPGPEEVFWPSLWLNSKQRAMRASATMPLIALTVVLPISAAVGAMSQLDYLLCVPHADSGCQVLWPLYCQDHNAWSWILKRLLSGWVPALLLVLWQAMVLPRLFYFFAQAERSCFSLSQLDRRIAELYFYWDVFNAFTQGVLGSSVLMQLERVVKNPQSMVSILGAAVPASSNFFTSYIVLRALFLVPLRMCLPHGGVWQYWLKRMFWGSSCCTTPTDRDLAYMYSPRTPRYGLELGIMMLMFLIGLTFSLVAPVILPLVVAHFAMLWCFWRYVLLYVYVRKYESGGYLWTFVFQRICQCLLLYSVFTACVLLTKQGYIQAFIILITAPHLVLYFSRKTSDRFKAGMNMLPLVRASDAPRASVPPQTYYPPPLKDKSLGWYPEWQKAWDGWGMPS